MSYSSADITKAMRKGVFPGMPGFGEALEAQRRVRVHGDPRAEHFLARLVPNVNRPTETLMGRQAVDKLYRSPARAFTPQAHILQVFAPLKDETAPSVWVVRTVTRKILAIAKVHSRGGLEVLFRD
jgi:hypothetical protein